MEPAKRDNFLGEICPVCRGTWIDVTHVKTDVIGVDELTRLRLIERRRRVVCKTANCGASWESVVRFQEIFVEVTLVRRGTPPADRGGPGRTRPPVRRKYD